MEERSRELDLELGYKVGRGEWEKHKRHIQDKTQMTNEHNSQKDKQNYSLSLNSGVFSCVQQRPRRLHSSWWNQVSSKELLLLCFSYFQVSILSLYWTLEHFKLWNETENVFLSKFLPRKLWNVQSRIIRVELSLTAPRLYCSSLGHFLRILFQSWGKLDYFQKTGKEILYIKWNYCWINIAQSREMKQLPLKL